MPSQPRDSFAAAATPCPSTSAVRRRATDPPDSGMSRAGERSERLPFSLKVLLENLVRTEDGANITARAHPGAGELGSERGARHRDPVHPGPGDHAGLHRRALRRRPGHHARGDGRPRRRPGQDQPAGAGRDGHRPLRHRRRLRPRRRLRAQRRAGVRAQPRALPVPALGPDRVRRVQGRPARHRHRAPGQHRAPGPGGHGPRRRRLPGHPGRHRLAHHHGQRPRRAGLGRRRHRGRGGHARPAGVDAHPAGRRLQADRLAAGRHHRHRPGADHHRDAAQARRGRQVRRVLRRGRRRRAAGQPGHHRQHEPGVRLHRGDVPDRRRDHQLPAADRPAGVQLALVEAYAKAQGLWHDPPHEPVFSEYLALDLATIVPSIAGPKRPQDRVDPGRIRAGVPQGAAGLRRPRRAQRGDEAGLETFPASDAPSTDPDPDATGGSGTRPGRGGHRPGQQVQPTGDDGRAGIRARPRARRRSPPSPRAPTRRTRR